MAKKMNTVLNPETAAVASGCPSPASQQSAQAAMQNLKSLTFLLVKETKELREKIKHLRSELVAAEYDRCSTAEACAPVKAPAAEKTTALLKIANDSAAELCLAKKMLLDTFRDKNAMEMYLKRAMEERDLCQTELDQERMRLSHFKQVLAHNFSSLLAVGTEYCRRLEEGVMSRERALQYAEYEMNLLKRFLKEKMDLIMELERENEKVREEGKMREGHFFQSARHEKNLLEEQLTTEFNMLKSHHTHVLLNFKTVFRSGSRKVKFNEIKFNSQIAIQDHSAPIVS